METDSGMVVVRGWGKERIDRHCLMGTEFKYCKTKRVLEMDHSDGCRAM